MDTNRTQRSRSLCRRDGDDWRCLAVAPSYQAFLKLAQGETIDWDQPRFGGSVPDVRALLKAACELSGTAVDLVTIDMPMSTTPIIGRRAADNAVSREFGNRGCAAHSPSVSRPGALGVRLADDLVTAGYPLRTAILPNSSARQTIEVYPHPALLSLLPCSYRWQYKVSKIQPLLEGCRANGTDAEAPGEPCSYPGCAVRYAWTLIYPYAGVRYNRSAQSP